MKKILLLATTLTVLVALPATSAASQPAVNTAGFLRISVAHQMSEGLASRTAERTDARGYTAPACYHPAHRAYRVNCTTTLRYRDDDGTTAAVRYIVRAYSTRTGAWALMSLAPPYATGLVLER
jgi:hypothetical protein